MRQKTYCPPVVILFAGLGLFGSLARSPSFQAYRTFDIVALVVVGVCLGYAAALFAAVRRSAPDSR